MLSWQNVQKKKQINITKIHNDKISSQNSESKRKQSSRTSSTPIDKEPGLLLLLLLSEKQWLLTYELNQTAPFCVTLCDQWCKLTQNIEQLLKILSQQSNKKYPSATQCPFGWLFHVLLLARLWEAQHQTFSLDCQPGHQTTEFVVASKAKCSL